MGRAPDELLLHAASKFAGLSRHRLLILAATGEIRARQVGGRVFLDTRDLERLRDGGR